MESAMMLLLEEVSSMKVQLDQARAANRVIETQKV
jgi:hypothetical protein